MSKNNKKKHRTDGTITSCNMKIPSSLNSSNSPLADTEYTDKERLNDHYLITHNSRF